MGQRTVSNFLPAIVPFVLFESGPRVRGMSALLALGSWALRGEDSGSSEEGEDLLYGLVEVEDMRASGEGSEMGAKASWKFRGNVLCRKNGSHPVTFPIPEGSVGNA